MMRSTSAVALLALCSSALTAPVLGQRIDLSRRAVTALKATGLCQELSCKDAVIARIDPRTTYLGVLDGGAFTYLVDGKVAMMGWMGRPHGESPLTPSPAQFNRLASRGAGQAIPRSWLKVTWDN